MDGMRYALRFNAISSTALRIKDFISAEIHNAQEVRAKQISLKANFSTLR